MSLRRAALAVVVVALAATTLVGCSTDADVASQNLSQDADQFKIPRRVVFLNGITDKYILSIEGNCSIFPTPGQIDVICKLPNGTFLKHSEGLSNNVTWFSQQMTGVDVSTLQYKVIFKPESLVPDFDRPAPGSK